jgi:hypothetical protein
MLLGLFLIAHLCLNWKVHDLAVDIPPGVPGYALECRPQQTYRTA